MKKFSLKKNAGKLTWKWMLLFFAIILSLQSGCAEKRERNQDFSAYTNQIFKSEITSSTLNMHYSLAHPENYGITDYPITYGNISSNSDIQSSAALENWKRILESYKKKDLTISQQMTYDIMMDYIETELPATKYNFYGEILKPNSGFQAQLPALLAEYVFYDEKDIEDYLGLISCTEDFFKQIIEVERQKSERGLFMSDFALDDVIAQCGNFIEDPESNYLLATFDDRIDDVDFLTPEQSVKYKARNRQVVLESLIPAYQKLIEDISGLKGTGKNTGGLCGLPQGKSYYEYLVKETTGSNLSVEEMQQMTEEQREKDLEDMMGVLQKNPDISQKAENYQLPTEDPKSILLDLQKKMQQDFPSPPQVSFTIKEVHPSMEKYTAPAFYLTPPIDDISKNCIYINKSKGDDKIQLYTTLAHEGFPGHLYQNVMERSCGLEPVRSLFGNSGYSEGWATYVEMQSYYYADIDKNLAAFFQKNQSALLSLYATADMGIHHDGWTLRDTIDFFSKYQITNKEVIQEIYQLIVEEPANYLKYYIGYLEFLNLKDYAMEKYKDNYSDYKFHQALMRMGAAPFPILREYLQEYWE